MFPMDVLKLCYSGGVIQQVEVAIRFLNWGFKIQRIGVDLIFGNPQTRGKEQ